LAVSLRLAGSWHSSAFSRMLILAMSLHVFTDDVADKIAAAPCTLRGLKISLPSQTHMYMEPQTTVAVSTGP
jgi:hypothetical protein